jgi:DNA-binding NarL/FixJ family response regulator
MQVVVVSSVALYREGLCALLGACDDVDVVGVAADAPNAARVLLGMAQAPDLVLFDMSQPESTSVVRWLIDEVPEARVFAVAVSGSEREVITCAELGVVGLVTADASVNELVASLEATARGEMRCSPAVAAALLRRVTARARAAGRSPLPVLTRREGEIGGLIADGLSNKQIARRLCIALPTVRNHVHSILAKLGVHSRTEAAVLIRRAATVHASD